MEPVQFDKHIHVFSPTEPFTGPLTRSRSRHPTQQGEDNVIFIKSEVLENQDWQVVENNSNAITRSDQETTNSIQEFIDNRIVKEELTDEADSVNLIEIEDEESENIVTNDINTISKPQSLRSGGFRGPYKCNLCHIEVSGSQKLRDHIINTHLPKNKGYLKCKFQCLECHKIYTKCTTLNSHWKNHWKTKPFPCTHSTCKNSYATSKELRIHLISHTTERPYQCRICQQTFKRIAEFNSHEKRSKKNDFNCEICNVKFCLLTKHTNHMKDHQNPENTKPKIHHCNICGETMLRKLRDKHMQAHFVDKRPYHCTLCSNSFTQFTGLEMHMRHHTGEKPYECTVCKKQFSQSSNLKTHARVHTNPDNKFQCSKCFIRVESEVSLKKHKIMCGKITDYAIELRTPCTPGKAGTSSAKTSTVIYQCKECSHKKFTRKEYLQEHVFRHHLKMKFFDCSYCDMKFTHRTELQTHSRSHTGEQPFKCDICDKQFKQATHLKSHSAVHTANKPLECSFCLKTFKMISYLHAHLRLHTEELPYQCKMCPMAFPRSEVLKRHLNNHLGNKAFRCESDGCEKAFISKTELKLHTMTHTDERPFPCHVCNHSFRTNGKLLEHFRSKRHRELAREQQLIEKNSEGSKETVD